MSINTRRQQENYAAAGAVALETLGNIRTVMSFNGQRQQLHKYVVPRVIEHFTAHAIRYEAALREGRKNGERKVIWMGLGQGLSTFMLYCSYALAFGYIASHSAYSNAELRSAATAQCWCRKASLTSAPWSLCSTARFLHRLRLASPPPSLQRQLRPQAQLLASSKSSIE